MNTTAHEFDMNTALADVEREIDCSRSVLTAALGIIYATRKSKKELTLAQKKAVTERIDTLTKQVNACLTECSVTLASVRALAEQSKQGE